MAGDAYFETTFSTLAHGSTHYDFLFSSFQKLKYERHYYSFCVVAHLEKNYIKVIAKPPSNL